MNIDSVIPRFAGKYESPQEKEERRTNLRHRTLFTFDWPDGTTRAMVKEKFPAAENVPIGSALVVSLGIFFVLNCKERLNVYYSIIFSMDIRYFPNFVPHHEFGFRFRLIRIFAPRLLIGCWIFIFE